MNLIDKFNARWIEDADGCWLWTGKTLMNGYGMFYLGQYRSELSHRWSYEHHIGPIAEGLVADHLCHNDSGCEGRGRECKHRRCVNPAHLGTKTAQQNIQDSHLFNGKKTHCPKGHEYTPENTYQGRTGGRRCRECAREADRSPKRAEQQRRRRAAKREKDNHATAQG